MTDDKDITPAILLQHMQGMEKRIKKDFREELKEAIDPLKQDITIIKTEITGINKRLEHVKQNVFVLIVRTKAMHEHLQAIEKEKLPKIRKSVRKVNKRLEKQETTQSPVLVKA